MNDTPSVAPSRIFGSTKEVLLFLLLPLILLSLYVTTLLPGPGFSGDTSKFQFLGTILGTGHEPGEPLYILLTAVFESLIPFGRIAWKINFFSAVAATGTVCGIYFIQRRLGISHIVAWGFSLCTGLLYTVWSQAVIAEVYSLNAFFVAWIAYFYIAWEQSGEMRFFYLATYLYALSFGNHVTMITFLPALLLFVFLVDRRVILDVRVVLTVFLFIVLGIFQYLFIIIRSFSAPPGTYLEMFAVNIDGFLRYFGSQQLSQRLFPLQYPLLLIQSTASVGAYIVRELHFFIPLAAYGFYRMSGKHAAISWLFLLSITGNILFASGYFIHDIHLYLIPAYLLGIVLAAAGFDSMAQRIPLQFRVALVCVVLPVVLFVFNFPLSTQRHTTTVDRRTDEILRTVDSNAMIYCRDYSYAMTFFYKYYCEGWRQKNIHIIFSHEPFSTEFLFSQYLRNEMQIPLTVTRDEIPFGLRLYIFTGIDPQYLEHLGFKSLHYEAEMENLQDEKRDFLVKSHEQHNFTVTKRMDDLYEITLSNLDRNNVLR